MNATYHPSKPRASTRARSLRQIAALVSGAALLVACGGGGDGGLTGAGRLYDVGERWQGSVYEYFIPQDQVVAAQNIGPDLMGRCLAVATAWKRAGNSMLPAEDLVLKFFGSGGQSVTTPACLRAPNWPALEESVRNRAAVCAAVPSLGMIVWTQTNTETIGGFDRRGDNGQTGPEDWSSVVSQMERNRAADESDCLAAGGR